MYSGRIKASTNEISLVGNVSVTDVCACLKPEISITQLKFQFWIKLQICSKLKGWNAFLGLGLSINGLQELVTYFPNFWQCSLCVFSAELFSFSFVGFWELRQGRHRESTESQDYFTTGSLWYSLNSMFFWIQFFSQSFSGLFQFSFPVETIQHMYQSSWSRRYFTL